ncbi:immunoglobulin lambda-1 light chain-like [Polyodon spathula]|uniref:immunoglobulin lambda-1 light chain-like n=1 Tax=Polyodon spathula TaxID=7913 RepID=UPI001B7E2F9A|nr:immunoglobulin lambda-1 light chain-like [Polyodon spathula]
MGIIFCIMLYHCDSNRIKHFGAGTKLIVSDTPLKKPTLTVFPPFSKNGQVTLVCLAQNYFPDVIKLEWKKNNEIVAEGMVQNENDKATSLLKITDDKNFDEAHYSCQVTHESLSNGVHAESLPKKTAQNEKKETRPVIAPTCPPVQYTDDEKKETMSLSPFTVDTFAYTVLILKSVTYCGIISFLTYKMKSAEALGIKKRVP